MKPQPFSYLDGVKFYIGNGTSVNPNVLPHVRASLPICLGNASHFVGFLFPLCGLPLPTCVGSLGPSLLRWGTKKLKEDCNDILLQKK